MFTKVSIKNFKSIRGLEFTPKRVNVFIGEPNVGKSNVIEALAVFSEGSVVLRNFVRFRSIGDLFFDRDLSEPVRLEADGWVWELKFDSSRYSGQFVSQASGIAPFQLNHDGSRDGSWPNKLPTRYYSYVPLPTFHVGPPGFLYPPHGSNLVTLLATNKRLRSLVADLFHAKGYRLSIDVEQNELLLTKDVHGQLYQFNYSTVSETLRRIVFYMAALETNQNAILLLDEPEANTFPFYTTYLAERIALDETNQFFLTTHNPYILGSIVAKTPAKDLAVFVAEMVDYETVLKPVTSAGQSKILEYGPDAFLNLNHLIEE